MRSLRDVLYYHRDALSPNQQQLLGQINSADSLLRHVPVAQLQEQVKTIAATLRAAKCPARHYALAAPAQAQDDEDDSEQESVRHRCRRALRAGPV